MCLYITRKTRDTEIKPRSFSQSYLALPSSSPIVKVTTDFDKSGQSSSSYLHAHTYKICILVQNIVWYVCSSLYHIKLIEK